METVIMNYISLFSGIGGFDLAFERAGMECVGLCEIDDVAQSVLRHHFPNVPLYDDVREIGIATHEWGTVDLICGGVPCQPISQAAARSERDSNWLWPEMMRVINEIEPRWIIFENPEAIRFSKRGLGIILGNLTRNGYDCFWDVLSAAEFGAPHKRARLWLVANSNCNGKSKLREYAKAHQLQKSSLANRPIWPYPPQDLRMDDGIPNRVALKLYGNSLIPQIAEWIVRTIIKVDDLNEIDGIAAAFLAEHPEANNED